jgi:fructosamine-3-kinase
MRLPEFISAHSQRSCPLTIPEPLRRRIEAHLGSSESPVRIHSCEPIGGGCIHHAEKIHTSAGVFFVKWNPAPPPAMFSTEALGLAQIRATNTIKTPQVYLVGEPDDASPLGFLLMQWIESGPGFPDPARFGETLAAMHQAEQTDVYGWTSDNYIGSTPQINHPAADWPLFFSQQRLKPQIDLARRNGFLNPPRLHKLESLLDRIPDLLSGVPRRPSLLHGDLWAGNVLNSIQSGPCLIDPAVYWGDREAEIAFTELFGGFPTRFYQAYNSVWPLEAGYKSRRDLYNLYHALNHLNIFGESYISLVDGLIQPYVHVLPDHGK